MSTNTEAMPDRAQPVPRMVVSTDALPERDRARLVREDLSKSLNLDIIPLSDAIPRQRVDYVAAGSVGFSLLEGSPSRFVRSQRHLRDCDENFLFGLFVGGWETLSHNGHSARVGTGDAFLVYNGLTLDACKPEGAKVTLLSIDGRALRALVKEPERVAGEQISGARPGVALLKGYLAAFTACLDTLTPEILHGFGLHVVDLVAAILGATRDGAAQAAAGGVKAARLRAVLAAIAERATDPGFDDNLIAKALGVTPRYVRRLLEETGMTLTQHVLEHRLSRAWRLLTDPACSLKIVSIACDCGFGDLSHFNRSFRRRFGETPSAVRARAMPGGCAGGPGQRPYVMI
jgi:AraC-like DNA-binding protein